MADTGESRMSRQNHSLKFLAERKRYILLSALLFMGLAISFQAISQRWGLLIAPKDQQCFPYTFWTLNKTQRPGKAEYAAFRWLGVSLIPEKIKWVKRIVGAPGDLVNVEKLPETGRPVELVEYESGNKPLIIQGYVFVFDHDRGLLGKFTVFAKDSQGNILPMIEPQIIPEGKYYVAGDNKRSSDSRYWGLIDETWIIGQAHPIY